MHKTDAMRTDSDWEHFASTDPYWAVLTAEEFRSPNLNREAKTVFFGSGEETVGHVLRMVRWKADPAFAPRRVLDFGCGVGRLLIPFARQCEAVVGVDVADSMLREAAANCQAFGLGNVELVKGDDELSAVRGSFDLVHTCLVLQHIPVERGLRIFRRLVELVAPGGCGALHVIYWMPPTPAAPPAPEPPRRGGWRSLARAALAPLRGRRPLPAPTAPVSAQPEMQMNAYPLNSLVRILRESGVPRTHVELTDHHGMDGPDGVQFFFRREAA